MNCAYRHQAWLALACSLVGVGCARPATPAVSPPRTSPASDGSRVCERLADRFVGLPALNDSPTSATSNASALAGRWWIRRCTASIRDRELRVVVQGPGWYFVDHQGKDLSLHQQVPFELGVELEGRVRANLLDGVFSLWLIPDAEPKVEVRASEDLDVQASSAWGTFLHWLPLVPLRAMAAERFASSAANALRSKLREGATATYDLRSGQSDATLGKLALGLTPERAFHDRVPWLVNERLLLADSTVHVVGPITPGPTRLDVIVEQGAGVVYRTACAQDIADNYPALASGHVEAVPGRAFVSDETLSGLGPHTTEFQVNKCQFYLVVSALRGASPTVASLRVRA